MSTSLFRQTSAGSLHAQEQLDRTLTVTTARSWLALAGIGIVFAGALIWSLTGSISTNVPGKGILVSSGGIRTVVTPVSGLITDIRMKPGESIRKGDTLFRLDQPELVADIRRTEEKLKLAAQAEQRSGLQAELNLLREQLEQSSQVKSAFDGQVVEVKVSRGDFVQTGSPLFAVELTGDELNRLLAILYVSPQLSETIQEGMEVKLHPSSVMKEQYGYLLGTVTSVDKFPSNARTMMNLLGNEQVVQMLAGGGAPVKVTVNLTQSAGTASGYKWSTPGGPPIELESGTMTDGFVTAAQTRPIAKLFPALK